MVHFVRKKEHIFVLGVQTTNNVTKLKVLICNLCSSWFNAMQCNARRKNAHQIKRIHFILKGKHWYITQVASIEFKKFRLHVSVCLNSNVNIAIGIGFSLLMSGREKKESASRIVEFQIER